MSFSPTSHRHTPTWLRVDWLSLELPSFCCFPHCLFACFLTSPPSCWFAGNTYWIDGPQTMTVIVVICTSTPALIIYLYHCPFPPPAQALCFMNFTIASTHYLSRARLTTHRHPTSPFCLLPQYMNAWLLVTTSYLCSICFTLPDIWECIFEMWWISFLYHFFGCLLNNLR
jgi:hypothetical protein